MTDDTYPRASFSVVTVRTTDGLRVALAGLPATMPVVADSELSLEILTVADARKIGDVPTKGFSVCIPFRLLPESDVKLFIPVDEAG